MGRQSHYAQNDYDGCKDMDALSLHDRKRAHSVSLDFPNAAIAKHSPIKSWRKQDQMDEKFGSVLALNVRLDG